MLNDPMKAFAAEIARQFAHSVRTLYRGRPYTKSVPFQVTLNTTGLVPLWPVKNAYFEFNRLYIMSTVAAIDINIVDTDPAQVIVPVVPSTALYTLVDLGSVGYRSTLAQNATLGLVDPTASGAVVKGAVFGWEVTPEGTYR